MAGLPGPGQSPEPVDRVLDWLQAQVSVQPVADLIPRRRPAHAALGRAGCSPSAETAPRWSSCVKPSVPMTATPQIAPPPARCSGWRSGWWRGSRTRRSSSGPRSGVARAPRGGGRRVRGLPGEPAPGGRDAAATGSGGGGRLPARRAPPGVARASRGAGPVRLAQGEVAEAEALAAECARGRAVHRGGPAPPRRSSSSRAGGPSCGRCRAMRSRPAAPTTRCAGGRGARGVTTRPARRRLPRSWRARTRT